MNWDDAPLVYGAGAILKQLRTVAKKGSPSAGVDQKLLTGVQKIFADACDPGWRLPMRGIFPAGVFPGVEDEQHDRSETDRDEDRKRALV